MLMERTLRCRDAFDAQASKASYLFAIGCEMCLSTDTKERRGNKCLKKNKSTFTYEMEIQKKKIVSTIIVGGFLNGNVYLCCLIII